MTTRCPYPGLRNFDFADSRYFYGREQVVDALIERFQASPLLALVGPSGCGKTSLIRAGLIPALFLGSLKGFPTKWRVIHIQPGTRIFKEFAKELVGQYLSLGNLAVAWQAHALVQAGLNRGPDSLVETLKRVADDERFPLLLVIDPIKALFRDPKALSDEARAFLAQVLTAASGPCPIPVRVVVAIESDSLGECTAFPELFRAITQGVYLIPELTTDQTRAAIVEPAAQEGCEVEPSLADRLIAEMANRREGLPLLQYLLLRVWHRAHDGWTPEQPRPALTLGHLEAEPGFGEILERGAESVLYEKLNARQRQIAAMLFRLLTERTVIRRDARTPVLFGDICKKIAGATPAEITAVANVFRRPDVALITPPEEYELSDDVPVELSHECLMRHWAWLGRWKDRESDVFLSYHSTDLQDVREIAKRLRVEGIRVWFDDWDLRPGTLWMSEIEDQLQAVNSVAVFIGSDGLGPWQKEEIQASLAKSVARGCSVIPVLLKSTKVNADLPLFLGNRGVVDFRTDEHQAWKRLIWGITNVLNSDEGVAV